MGIQIRTVIAGASRRDERNNIGGMVSQESTYPDVTVEIVEDDSAADWTTGAIVDAVNAVAKHAAAAFVTVGDVGQEEAS